MAFIDKLLRFKRKPFGATDKREKQSEVEEKKVAKDSKPKVKATSPESHGNGKLAHILIRPHISEQTSDMQANGKYVFEVSPKSAKHDIARAIKDLYNVDPVAVNILNLGGRKVRFGRTTGKTKSWKKAIVTLPKGKSIDLHKA